MSCTQVGILDSGSAKSSISDSSLSSTTSDEESDVTNSSTSSDEELDVTNSSAVFWNNSYWHT